MNHVLITFLVIIGAGAGVLLGYAVSYLYLSQPLYLAEVRDRNVRDILSRTS
jgi:hypothetical protein